jgi:EamA domain-containing membrane protein RarD
MEQPQKPEMDRTYLLKLILYLIVGSQWLKIQTKGNVQIPIPVGALIGLIFAAHEHFQMDRKVEYAIIVVAMFIGFWVPLGAVLKFT